MAYVVTRATHTALWEPGYGRQGMRLLPDTCAPDWENAVAGKIPYPGIPELQYARM